MSAAPRPVVPAVNQWSAEYLEQQYGLFRTDPGALPPELRAFFQGFELAQAGELRLFGMNGSAAGAVASGAREGSGGVWGGAGGHAEEPGIIRIMPTIGRPAGRVSPFEAVVDDLIGAYRDQGHLCARIDPFGRERARPSTLELDYHNITERELGRVVDGTGMGLGASVTVRELIDHIGSTGCR